MDRRHLSFEHGYWHYAGPTPSQHSGCYTDMLQKGVSHPRWMEGLYQHPLVTILELPEGFQLEQQKIKHLYQSKVRKKS